MNKLQLNFSFILIGLAVILIVISQSLFIVDQREHAIVLQLGQPVGDLRGPGLHLKIPLVQEVRHFDRRILPVDPGPEQVVIASSSVPRERITPIDVPDSAENDAIIADSDAPPPISDVSGEPIIVDSFARYRITDPLQFMKTLRTVEAANSRLENILDDASRTVLGKSTLKELLSAEREEIMREIRDRVNRSITTDELGIEMVDVRIVRADLTADLRTSTVRRMISQLKERATETRAMGEERALEIRSVADKERAIILANARRDSEILRGQGDQEAIGIYADAYNKDKEFYGFLRSMEAYDNTLASPDTRLILSPESDFFRFFGDRQGR